MPALSLNDFAKQELGYQPGTRIPAAEASKIRAAYQRYINKRIDIAAAAERPAFEPSAGEVILPDGSKRVALKTSPNSAQYEQPYQAPQMQLKELEDGTIVGVSPVTLEVIRSWDKQTGASVKAAKKVDPFAALLGGAPQSAPVGQSGAATLEPPTPSVAPAPQPTAPAPAPTEPQIYKISGEDDYAKVPTGATVNWNGQTFTKR